MNNDDILSKYIEKVDRDQSDLRADMREIEKKTANTLENIERRMDLRLNRIEDLIAKQNDDLNKKIPDSYSKLESKINEANREFKVMNRQFLIFLIGTFLSIAGILAA
ncbi:MAG TPA: hypothetical protein PKY26_06450, partial [Acetivibrio clariflavus]|nr:hypothetical protein [Acetivibrio clariflavus]